MKRARLWDRLVYRALVWRARPNDRSLSARLWGHLTPRMSGYTSIRMHGRDMTVNAGYAYPAFMRRWPTYNDPLVELVHLCRVGSDHRLHLVDVGAAVGDTALLVMDRCPGDVALFTCIEPDREFFSYLSQNFAGHGEVVLHNVMLSGSSTQAPELIRTHAGTASAQGTGVRPTVTLDEVLADAPPVDVLKIDTDGYDGMVLRGASTRLAQDKPVVIFEWHPILAERTGQDWQTPFQTLDAAGYEWYVWFTKEGEFSHVSHGHDPETIAVTANVCLSDAGPRPDWHFDVVALRPGAVVTPERMAELAYARTRRSL